MGVGLPEIGYPLRDDRPNVHKCPDADGPNCNGTEHRWNSGERLAAHNYFRNSHQAHACKVEQGHKHSDGPLGRALGQIQENDHPAQHTAVKNDET